MIPTRVSLVAFREYRRDPTGQIVAQRQRSRRVPPIPPLDTGIDDDVSTLHQQLTLVLFFASGFGGLVYEVLWMKELGLLFGNTAQAAATTLAAFFLGLVVGSRYWGRKAAGVGRPLRMYAILEAGVAASALMYFLLMDAYHAVYGPLFEMVGDSPSVFLTTKFLLATGVLLPPAFFMGGTLPMMSQHLVRRASTLGRTTSILYAVNVAGASVGAGLAGFVLPRALGFTTSYYLAVATSGGIALVAWLLDAASVPRPAVVVPTSSGASPTRAGTIPASGVRTLAFLSGLVTLGLQVLWTRMFAQVLQNSVYTFATILVTFLGALTAGAALARWLIGQRYAPAAVLTVLLAASAVAVATTPFVFHGMTHGMEYVGGTLGFGSYIRETFWLAIVVMVVPGVMLGAIFPYLLRVAEPFSRSAGETVGDLAAINMVGAVVGSLAAGFLLLDVFGLWASMWLLAIACLAASFVLLDRIAIPWALGRAVVIGGLLLLLAMLDPSRLPIVSVDPVGKQESLLQVWEGSAGIVSVIRQPGSLNIKLDNDYSLGGTGASVYEEAQAHLPLLLHPRPRSVFFMGMGTGITAGAALAHPVERVVVSEISPDVVEAARTFFRPYVHGLFDDSRATVVVEDGRNYLFGARERFDVVVSDLFMPWKAGVGSLYSRDHYRVALARLNDRGLYVQWLPLYQVSKDEFGVVARTMQDVFPLVTLWRGTIEPGWETAALIGHHDARPLDRAGVAHRLEESQPVTLGPLENETGPSGEPDVPRLAVRDMLLQYAGNVTAAARLVEQYPVNTDDRPIIEYAAPIAHRRNRASQASWFVGRELVEFLGNLMLAAPPESDPYLRELSPVDLGVIRAGLGLYIAQVFEASGDTERAASARRQFERLYTGEGEGHALTESTPERDRHEP